MHTILLLGIGLGTNELYLLAGIYLVVMVYSIFYIINGNGGTLRKVVELVYILAIPILGLAFFWGEVLVRWVIFRKGQNS